MRRIFFLIVSVVIICGNLFSQSKLDIEIPDHGNYYKVCGYCMERLEEKPPEILMSVEVDKNRNILFLVNNAKWFWNFLHNTGIDAVAADIVFKSS